MEKEHQDHQGYSSPREEILLHLITQLTQIISDLIKERASPLSPEDEELLGLQLNRSRKILHNLQALHQWAHTVV